MTKQLPILLDTVFKKVSQLVDADLANLIDSPEARKVIACSQFVADFCMRNPDEVKRLITGVELNLSRTRQDYSRLFSEVLQDIDDEELMSVMRRFRNREMVRIAWRDIAGLADLEETTSDLSLLAEEMLDKTLAFLHNKLAARFGEPESTEGEPQKLVIIAMGKLGAHELNFSSDIDLIFAFPEAGETNAAAIGKKKNLDNQEFFIRLGKQLIKAFNEITADGFVFRMDMRLRPFGESGALALNFSAMEEYYVSHARDWERYAMIKANVAAGDKVAGTELMKMLIPFVFRRYLDYGAYHSIREMKGMINREVLRKGITTDVKLGHGGIREIEFIGQTFQLLRGGREPRLQTRKILEVLKVLQELDMVSCDEGNELREAYIFLRNTEHRIQEIADQQTQALPTTELDQVRVAFGMGSQTWDAFLLVLAEHRERVSVHFSQLLRTPDDEEDTEESESLSSLWLDQPETDLALNLLEKAGFLEVDRVLQMLAQLRNNYGLDKLSIEAQKRLDRLMPSVLEITASVEQEKQIVTLERVFNLIAVVAKRSVYLSLLSEHPKALSRLIELCSASPWIADYIAKQPILLDELIDRDSLYSPPAQAELSILLNDQLIHLPQDDLERQMDTLRHFRHSQVLRVAAADIMRKMPLAEVSNHLSYIAEVVLIAAAEMAYREMVQRFGEPCCSMDGESRVANFTIIGYGKLGGFELGFSSDLDVVFLHDSMGKDQYTNGNKQVDNSVFFNRFGQRLIHILTMMTRAGRTYEIDTRLRPSGMSGFLVTSMDAFAEYQEEKAWTWEHQALVRARPISGAPVITNVFEDIRKKILSRKRDDLNLKKDVREMREKMRDALVKHIKGMFDLKQGLGGMADIEFIVQYSVLRWAGEFPQLLEFTDNLRLFEVLADLDLLKREEASLLKDAYFSYRADGHRLALQGDKAIAPGTDYLEYRRGVEKIWAKLLED